MKSVIICEGATDLVLVQYFMEKANGWEYDSYARDLFGFIFSKTFKKNANELLIGEVGGCGNIINCLRKLLDRNLFSASADEAYGNIVIICDRDEADTVEDFETKIVDCLKDFTNENPPRVDNDAWNHCSIENERGETIFFRVLLLVIPFENTGALETFLLDAISANDSYDGQIIATGNSFVETVDREERYLTHRRHKTKAKFDVYFSIRTPYEQYSQRQDILRGIDWENYEFIQDNFKKLKELG